jgi:hypothetical protein
LYDRDPSCGFPVVPLHGWPDHVRASDRVVANFSDMFLPNRAVLRGFSPIDFGERLTMANGQLLALG